MNTDPTGHRKALFLVAASILTLVGAVGVFGNRAGYTDALFEPDFTIQHVPDGGPLAEAGFQAGDSVISVEGIPVVDLGMYSRWPLSLSRRPGESITLEVERNGELVSGQVVYRARPASVQKMQIGALLVFLSFLWAGVWALFTTPSVHASRLATLGLVAGLTVQSPNAGSWNGLVEHIHMAAMVLWTILLLRFFLAFPRPKPVAQAHLTTLAIYVPWFALLVCLVVEILFHPRYYHSFGGYMGLLMLAYILLALAGLLHTWAKTPRGEVGRSGLGWVLVGMGVGVGGIVLWAVDALLLLGTDIPGTSWAPVLFGVVPFGMALGVRKATLRG